MPSSRRSLLTGLAAVLAGCTATPAQSSDDPTLSPVPVETDDGTPTRSPTDGPTTAEHYRSLEFQVYETDVVGVGKGVLRGDEHLDPFEADIIDRAVESGSTTFTTYTYHPLRDRTYVHRDDYFRLDRTVDSEREITVHRFELDAISDCSKPTPTAHEVVPYDDLSPADRRAFVHSHERYLSEDACFGSSYYYHYESTDAVESSQLVTDSPTYVSYEDDVYVVEFVRTQTVPERTYRFEATRLGATREEYGERVAPEVVWTVDPDELTSDERQFLATLVEDGHYRKENPIPEYVDGVADAIRANGYSIDEFGPYFLQYEGTYYRASVEEVMS